MVDEYVSAVARFADDLSAVGIPQTYIPKAMGLYSIALFQPSHEAWTNLYRHVSELLQECHGDALECDAARRLFALVDDDFARSVLELPVRMRLRALLLEYQVAS